MKNLDNVDKADVLTTIAVYKAYKEFSLISWALACLANVVSSHISVISFWDKNKILFYFPKYSLACQNA